MPNRPSPPQAREPDVSPLRLPGSAPVGSSSRPSQKDAPSHLEPHIRVFEKGDDIIAEHRPLQSAYMLKSGWAYSYKLMRDGARQVIHFYVPGDYMGISRVLRLNCFDNVCAATNVEAAEIRSEALTEALHGGGSLAISVLSSSLRDEAIVAAHLVDVGRRHPIDRVAHLFLELGVRLTTMGLGTISSYDCPLTQSLIADALGLTAAHFNRVLRALRDINAMRFRHGHVEIFNRHHLERLVDFDATYLPVRH